MVYAYFKNKEKYDILPFIDKMVNGNITDLPSTISELQVNNIYISNKKFNHYLKIYLSNLNMFYKTIDELLVNDVFKYPYLQEFIVTIEQNIACDKNIIETDEREFKANWCQNKKMFRLDNYTVNKELIDLLTRTFFDFGYTGGFSFNSIYKYISSFFREDYQNPKEKRIKDNEKKGISSFIQKNKDMQSLCKDIKYNSLLIYMRQHKLFNELSEIRTNLVETQTLYMKMNVSRDVVLKELCKYYYELGEAEKYRCRTSTVQKQIDKNKIIFNGKTCGFVVKQSNNKICKICSTKNKTLYDIFAYTPFEYMLISACEDCLNNVDTSLQQINKSKFTEYEIGNQMIVKYKKFAEINTRCNCCGKMTNAFFEVESIRNPQQKFCKECFSKLSTNVSKKNKKK